MTDPGQAAGGPQLPRTAGDMLAMARGFLARKGVEEARLEGELLVAASLELDRLGLFMALDRPLQPFEIDRARDMLVRRGRREPVAYIIGKREFYGRDFLVGPGVLIPRPETELLVDLAKDACADASGVRILDVGTGSGCLALTLALELAGSEVTGVDLSPAALGFARRNGEALGAAVRWLESDGLCALPEEETFDLIVSNPPYVDPGTAGELQPEVRDHEPEQALFAPAGRPDHWVERLIAEALPRLRPGGRLMIELGHDQGPRVLPLARAACATAELHADLAGIPRALVLQP